MESDFPLVDGERFASSYSYILKVNISELIDARTPLNGAPHRLKTPGLDSWVKSDSDKRCVLPKAKQFINSQLQKNTTKKKPRAN